MKPETRAALIKWWPRLLLAGSPFFIAAGLAASAFILPVGLPVAVIGSAMFMRGLTLLIVNPENRGTSREKILEIELFIATLTLAEKLGVAIAHTLKKAPSAILQAAKSTVAFLKAVDWKKFLLNTWTIARGPLLFGIGIVVTLIGAGAIASVAGAPIGVALIATGTPFYCIGAAITIATVSEVLVNLLFPHKFTEESYLIGKAPEIDLLVNTLKLTKKLAIDMAHILQKAPGAILQAAESTVDFLKTVDWKKHLLNGWKIFRGPMMLGIGFVLMAISGGAIASVAGAPIGVVLGVAGLFFAAGGSAATACTFVDLFSPSTKMLIWDKTPEINLLVNTFTLAKTLASSLASYAQKTITRENVGNFLAEQPIVVVGQSLAQSTRMTLQGLSTVTHSAAESISQTASTAVSTVNGYVSTGMSYVTNIIDSYSSKQSNSFFPMPKNTSGNGSDTESSDDNNIRLDVLTNP